jgi:hypothetical protein
MTRKLMHPAAHRKLYDLEARDEQEERYSHRRERLELLVAVRVGLIPLLRCDGEPYQSDDVRGSVEKRVETVGYHADGVDEIADHYLDGGHQPVEHEDGEQDPLCLSEVVLGCQSGPPFSLSNVF